MTKLAPMLAALLLSAGMPAGAQEPRGLPEPPPRIVSMGQPPLWQPYVAGVGTFDRTSDVVVGGIVGVHHPFGSPVNGMLGMGLEGYVLAGAEPTGGARLLGVARALNLGAGIDWDARAQNVNFVMSFNTAVRRGGILGRGTMLRIDWVPARTGGLDVGLTVPLGQPYAGRTRPKHTGVWLSEVAREAAPPGRAPAPDLPADTTRDAQASRVDSAMGVVRSAARMLALYGNFFGERHQTDREKDIAATREVAQRLRDTLAVRSPDFPAGRSFAAAEQAYHAQLERAFGLAAGDARAGPAIASRGRAGLLEWTLLPYDALFGRVKNRSNDLSPLLDAARDDFAVWLADSSGVAPARRGAVLAVHSRWREVVRGIHHDLIVHWVDSRGIWLPLQLALRPEEHDDQAEIDALIARAVRHPFVAGNDIRYLHENRVQVEIARSILSARDYHVLWVHDFAGQRPSGSVDRVAFRQVADVYFPALTRAVERYDSTGKLTAYLIFLDQNFYEPANGRLWMTILENPLGASIDLPKGNDSLATVLHERQAALRQAVAGSRGLQALAAAQGGEKWLRRTVKVHVSITQPSDFTFRSHRIIPPVPLLPDNLMRDHRKIAFYDVTESAPDRGAMVLSGVGVGEHYATPTWEDRGLLVRGPAVLEVRAAARRLLRANGFADADVPPPLRATAPCAICTLAAGPHGGGTDAASTVPSASTSADTAAPDPLGRGRALQVHNEPGFAEKQASIARAMLYDLAPRGSVIAVPDGLWLGSTWAGMLAGAALRGCRVLIVGPALANAPSAGFPQLSRTQDVMLRLLLIREEFGDAIRAAGGDLRIGLYTAQEDVDDAAAQTREMRAGLRRNPWLQSIFPMSANALAVLDTAPAALERAGYRAFALGRDEKPRLPQLHRKTQLVADSAALAQLMKRPEWDQVAIRYFITRAAQSRRHAVVLADDDTLTVAMNDAVVRLLRGYLADRPPADRARATFYLTVGTQNQDPRGMQLDGEAVYVLSGTSAASGIYDMLSLLARTTWLETPADLDRLLPPYGKWQRWLGRFARFVL